MNVEIQLALIGIGSAVISSFCTWFFSRKKTNAEVDSTQLDNLAKQLEFYKNLVADYKQQLQEYIELSEDTRLEVLRLRKVVGKIVNDVCLAKNCNKKIYMDDNQVEVLIGGNKDDTKIKEGV